MVDSRDALLSFIVLGAGAAGAVVGGFWLAVFWMRSLGKKVGYSLAPLGFSRPRGGFLAGIGAGMAVGVGRHVTAVQVGDRADRIIARARRQQGNVALFAHGHLLRVVAARADRPRQHPHR